MSEEAKRDNKLNTVFTEILIMERNKRSWSQNDLADELGVNESTIKRWQGGLSLPNNYARRKLQEVLQLSLKDLGLNKDFHDQLSLTRNNREVAPEEGTPGEGVGAVSLQPLIN